MDLNVKEVLGVVDTPAYVFLGDVFQKNLDDLLAAFRSRYANMKLGYSYKTNYLPYVCKAVDERGCFAEVVSPMEYRHALENGVEGVNIIFNGPCKTRDAIEDAIFNRSIINVDSYHELQMVISAGLRTGIVPRLGLRLNIDVGNGLRSRFGIDPDSKEFDDAIQLARSNGVYIQGLHCHVSKARGLAAWRRRAEVMADCAEKVGALWYIDLGGNMYGRMPSSFAQQFMEPIPTFDEYAEAVCGVFRDRFSDESVRLVLEPGTALVSDAMVLVSKVVQVKDAKGTHYAFLDCSSFDLGFAGEYKKPPITTYDAPGAPRQEYVLTGCTCIEKDIIAENVAAALEPGSIVVVENIGAYSNNLSADFIKPGLPICLKTGDSIKMVRRRTGYPDAFAEYMEDV